jgi:hypothetical protein
MTVLAAPCNVLELGVTTPEQVLTDSFYEL